MDRAPSLAEHYREPDHRAALAADPERAALATAIARHADAAERLDRIRSALDRLPSSDEMASKLEAATAALADARLTENANTVARLLGEPADPDPVPAAKAAHAETADSLAQVRQQRDLLAGQERQAETTLSYRLMDLKRDLAAVLQASPAVAALAEAFAAAQRRVVELRAALRAVSAANGIPESHRLWEALPGDGFFPDRLPAVAAWRAAIAALAQDPNTPLPGLPSRPAA